MQSVLAPSGWILQGFGPLGSPHGHGLDDGSANADEAHAMARATIAMIFVIFIGFFLVVRSTRSRGYEWVGVVDLELGLDRKGDFHFAVCVGFAETVPSGFNPRPNLRAGVLHLDRRLFSLRCVLQCL